MSPDAIQSSCHPTHSLLCTRSHLGAGFLDISFPGCCSPVELELSEGIGARNVMWVNRLSVLYSLYICDSIAMVWKLPIWFLTSVVNKTHLAYRWFLKHSEEIKLVNREQMLAMWLPR